MEAVEAVGSRMDIPCEKCKSEKTYKLGHRKKWRAGISRIVQGYICNECGHEWTVPK